ncbi:MAG: ABC transporter permease [Candidatus Buchananbacteria bacterium]|jgi:putative ABC transport system permease protein
MISILNIATKSLINNKARTTLTVIGIVIGIAAVIIVMSAGESLKGLVTGQLDAFGSNLIQIEVKVPSASHTSVDNAAGQAQGIQITTLTLDDAEAISKLDNIKNYYGAIMDSEIVSYLNVTKSATIFGVTPGYAEMGTAKIASGRFFTADEGNELARVAVLGSNLSSKLFGNQDPIGQEIKMGKTKFRIIGVMVSQGGGFGLSFDDMVFAPLQTMQKIVMGIDHVQFIGAEMIDASKDAQTAEDIKYLLDTRHKIEDLNKEDFAITTMAEAKAMIDSIFNGITLLLIAIAGISLLVGGVGIMNIMYVSVTERTFEIGLRKAVGAKKNAILWQFLLEAIILTLLGGFFGIAIGIAFSYLVSYIASLFGFSWDFILPPSSIFIAFGFSAAVGLIFGYYPAQHAAKMDPIEALRRE